MLNLKHVANVFEWIRISSWQEKASVRNEKIPCSNPKQKFKILPLVYKKQRCISAYGGIFSATEIFTVIILKNKY